MSISKLNAALLTTIIGLGGFATPVFAQVTTDDVDAQAILEQIRDNDIAEYDETSGFRDNDTRPHYQSQIEHYDREIKRLNAMIETFGYWKSESNDDPTLEELSGKNIPFDKLEPSTAARTAVHEAGDGQSSEFGIQIEGFESSGVSGVPGAGGAAGEFRTALGLQAADKLYPAPNSTYASNLNRLYSSLYVANTVAGEAHKGRKERLEVYDELLTQAKEAHDLQMELRVQNAILLENGRNLALLIDLQSAQLNAQTAEMTSMAVGKQKAEEMFGGGGTGGIGDAVFSAIITEIN